MINIKNQTELKEFIRQQRTIQAPAEKPQYPYSEYWIKPVMCILLSGRVKSSAEGDPNKSDINRVCKQANFDEYFFEAAALFLIKSNVIAVHDKFDNKNYVEGKNFKAFLTHDFKTIQSAAREAFLDFVQKFKGVYKGRSTMVLDSRLVEFLILFFACFKGRAFPAGEIGTAFLAFSKLPVDVLYPLMKEHGINHKKFYNWETWLDEKGRLALLRAFYATRWMYGFEHKQKDWIYLNQTGQMILNLTLVPPHRNRVMI